MSTVPIAIAHRGDPIAERENTLPAFEAAVLAGADMVELDLRRTADGEIVVLHDATLSRLTRPSKISSWRRSSASVTEGSGSPPWARFWTRSRSPSWSTSRAARWSREPSRQSAIAAPWVGRCS
jgi:glycerophosphoryl diester phosphodiesterase